jgi:DNA-binding MarR family transcriptional regulator
VVLIHLWREDGQNQHQLGERAGHHKTTVTRAIDNLELQNMVVRIQDTQDGRIRRVYLTHLGRTIRDQVIPQMESVQSAALTGIEKRDLATCKSVLLQIIQNLQQADDCASC